MAYEPMITEIEERLGKACVIAADVYVKRGDLIGYSSGWKLANAFGSTTVDPIPAQYIALETCYGDGAVAIDVCKAATFTDLDLPYTADTDQWLYGHATATGGHTETRPTTALYLRQKVGRSLTTGKTRIDLTRALSELELLAEHAYTNSGQGLNGTALDSGLFYGDQLDANTEFSIFRVRIPDNAVGVEKAKLLCAVTGSHVFDYLFSVTSAGHGEAHALVSDSKTATGVAPTVNTVHELDLLTAFDAANLIKPGRWLFCKFLRNTGGTDVVLAGDLVLTFRVA